MSTGKRRFWLVTILVPIAVVLALAFVSFATLDGGPDTGTAGDPSATRGPGGLSPSDLERRIQAEEDRVRGAMGQRGTAEPGAADAGASSSANNNLTDAGPTTAGSGVDLDADGGAILRAWLEKNADEAKRAVSRFCEENEKLAKDPVFPEPKGDRDAAVYMLPRVDWEDGVRPPGLLHLPQPLIDKIKAAGDDWPTKLSVKDLEGLDFSWMTELLQFDVWSSASYGPLRDDNDKAFFEAPIPNYISLMQWVRLRFVRAFATRDFPSAIAEVRHLAMLMSTQQLLIGDMVALAVLKLDARARTAAAAAGLDVSAWPAVDPEQLARARRAGLAGPFFFAPGVDDETVKKAGACLQHQCSAMVEALGFQAVLAPWSPRDNKATVDAVANRTQCSRQLFDRARAARPALDSNLRSLEGANRIAQLFPDGGIP